MSESREIDGSLIRREAVKRERERKVLKSEETRNINGRIRQQVRAQGERHL